MRGTVSLGTLSYLGALDIGKVLLEIHRRYPEVVVKLRLTVEGDAHQSGCCAGGNAEPGTALGQ